MIPVEGAAVHADVPIAAVDRFVQVVEAVLDDLVVFFFVVVGEVVVRRAGFIKPVGGFDVAVGIVGVFALVAVRHRVRYAFPTVGGHGEAGGTP